MRDNNGLGPDLDAGQDVEARTFLSTLESVTISKVHPVQGLFLESIMVQSDMAFP